MPLAGHDPFHLAFPPLIFISTPMPLAGHDHLFALLMLLQVTFLLPCPSRGMTLILIM